MRNLLPESPAAGARASGQGTCLLLAIALGLSGCGISSGGPGGAGGGDGEGGISFGGMSAGGSAFGAGGGGGGPPGPFDYSALCGVQGCVPGDIATPCQVLPEGGGGGAAGGSEGGGGQAQGGAGGGVQLLGSCQITDQRGEPVAECGEAGATIISGVCNSSADCLPGLGCVLASGGGGEGGGPGTPAVGLCRPYCCGDLEDCPASTFCAPQPMFDAASQLEDPSLALPVPVCMPVVGCQLLGDDCPDGQTCTVVRADGATSCVPVGAGTLCQPCECAEGFVCNFGTGLCMQLCDTGSNECPGEGALCQGGGTLPDKVGLCVGGDAACTL